MAFAYLPSVLIVIVVSTTAACNLFACAFAKPSFSATTQPSRTSSAVRAPGAPSTATALRLPPA
eukprot:2355238-Lingulodinium_polyedra.AAC.1